MNLKAILPSVYFAGVVTAQEALLGHLLKRMVEPHPLGCEAYPVLMHGMFSWGTETEDFISPSALPQFSLKIDQL